MSFPRVCTVRRPTPRHLHDFARSRGLHPSEAAAVTAQRWAPGVTLRVGFRPSTLAQRLEVTDACAEWSQYANVNFVAVLSGPCEVRVSFDPAGGSWSYVGKEILLVPPDEPTLNIGWPDDFGRSLHEIGHTLGLVHEHQNPLARIPWDRPKVYAFYGGSPNFWPPDEVDAQVLDPVAEPLTNGGFDRESIMLYPVPAELVTDPSFAVGWNTDLSEHDRSFIAGILPGRWTPTPLPTQPSAPPVSPPTPAPPTTLIPPPAVPPTPNPTDPLMNAVGLGLQQLLSYIPGEISKEVNEQAFASAVLQAELANPVPLTFSHALSVAAHAVVANAEAIFPDPFFRMGAVRLLTAAYGTS